MSSRVERTSSVGRSALCARFLSPCGLESVPGVDRAPLDASPSPQPAGGFPAHASASSPLPAGAACDQASRPREWRPGAGPAAALPGETASRAPAIPPLAHEMVPCPRNEVQRPAVGGPPHIVAGASPLLCDRRPEVGAWAGAAVLPAPLLALHHGPAPSLLRGFALQARLPTPAPP